MREHVIRRLKDFVERLVFVYARKKGMLNHTEDLVQEAYIGVLWALDHYEGGSFGALASRAAMNMLKRYYSERIRRRHRDGPSLEAMGQVGSATNEIELTKFSPPEPFYYCLNCGIDIGPKYAYARGIRCLCNRCKVARHNAKRRFGNEGMCDCGKVLRVRKKKPWCPRCHFDVQMSRGDA